MEEPRPHPHKGTDHVPKGAAEPNAVPTPGAWHSGLRQLLVTLDIPMLALNLGALSTLLSTLGYSSNILPLVTLNPSKLLSSATHPPASMHTQGLLALNKTNKSHLLLRESRRLSTPEQACARQHCLEQRAEFKPSSAHLTQLHNTQDALHLLRAKLSFPAVGPASEQQELNRGPQEAPPKQRLAKESPALRQKEFRFVPDPVSALRREKINNSPDLRQGGRCPSNLHCKHSKFCRGLDPRQLSKSPPQCGLPGLCPVQSGQGPTLSNEYKKQHGAPGGRARTF